MRAEFERSIAADVLTEGVERRGEMTIGANRIGEINGADELVFRELGSCLRRAFVRRRPMFKIGARGSIHRIGIFPVAVIEFQSISCIRTLKFLPKTHSVI